MELGKSTARSSLAILAALALTLAAGSTPALADVGLQEQASQESSARTSDDSGPSSPTAEADAAAGWDGVTPQQPVFSNGEAQPVHKGHPLVKDEVWIPVPGIDTDRDGKDDEIRATVYRPKDTDLGQDSIKVPSVVRMSPYNGGFNTEYFLHDMKQNPWDPSQPVPVGGIGTIKDSSGRPSNNRPNSSFYTDRGFAFVSVDALGTNESTGCPTMLDGNEAASTKAVVDWLAGRTVARDTAGNEARSTAWSTGKIGMTGVSYDGTLPILASTTGVPGLEAVVPISALSNFYDYYRVGGAVVEPAGYPGEDLDNYVSALLSTEKLQAACQYLAEDYAKRQDRATGQYSAFWAERNFLDKADQVKAPTLLAAGLSDWNVRLDQSTKWYQALKARNVPVKLVLHQYGHQTPPSSGDFSWTSLINKWFSHYLFGVANGVENTSEVSIQNADPGKAAKDKTWQYQPSWPLPGSGATELTLRPGSTGKSGLVAFNPAPQPGALPSGPEAIQTLTDDAKTSQQDLAAKPSAGRLLYASNPAKADIRLSGFATAKLNLSFSGVAPNLSLQLLDRGPDGKAKVVTRAWWDPQNRDSLTSSAAVVPGTFYAMELPFISTEYLLAKDHALELMVYGTDIDGQNCTTLCLQSGIKTSIDLSKSTVSVPFVGGSAQAFATFGSEVPPTPVVTPTETPVTPTTGPPTGQPTTPTVAPQTGQTGNPVRTVASAQPGQTIEIKLAAAGAGQELDTWLFSDPFFLGRNTASAQGSYQVTIPAEVPVGKHTIGVYLPDGTLFGSTSLSIVDGLGTDTGQTLAETGIESVPGALLTSGGALALGLLLLGAAVPRKRRH